MYPSGPVSFINSSEREFYNLFKDHPATTDWTVFYSHRMVSARYLNEIDFLLLIPDMGISLIELKANNPLRITQDTFTYNYMGKITEKENPFRKIKNLISQFKTILKMPGEGLEKIFVSHILIFPEYRSFFDKKICFSSNTDNYINALTERKDIPSQVISLHRKQNENILRKDEAPGRQQTNEMLLKIEKILRHEFEIDENTLARQFYSENAQNSKKNLLSRYLMIENLNRAVLAGPAGTGKTFSCVQQLIKKSKEGGRVAYFCHGPLSAIKISKDFSKVGNVEIYELKNYLARKLKKPVNDSTGIQDLIKEFLRTSPRPQYDFIAADDGEFYVSAHFLSLADKLLKNGLKDGSFWIAADEDFLEKEQAASFNDALASFNLKGVKVRLGVNYRNSPAISSLLSSFCAQNLYEKSEVSNLSLITPLFHQGYQESFLETHMDNLLMKYKPSEITFLSVRPAQDSLAGKLRKENRGWGKRMASLSSAQEGFFNYGDMDSFCGLESKVVIVTDIDSEFFADPKAGKRLYKIASRGVFKLVFLVDEKVRELFAAHFEGGL